MYADASSPAGEGIQAPQLTFKFALLSPNGGICPYFLGYLCAGVERPLSSFTGLCVPRTPIHR